MKLSISTLSCGMLFFMLSALPTNAVQHQNATDAGMMDAAGILDDVKGLVENVTDGGVDGAGIMDDIEGLVKDVTGEMASALEGLGNAIMVEFNDTMSGLGDLKGCISDTVDLFVDNSDLMTAHDAYLESYDYQESASLSTGSSSFDAMIMFGDDVTESYKSACEAANAEFYMEEGTLDCKGPEGDNTLKVVMKNYGGCSPKTEECETMMQKAEELDAELMDALTKMGMQCEVSKDDNMADNDYSGSAKNSVALGAFTVFVGGVIALL